MRERSGHRMREEQHKQRLQAEINWHTATPPQVGRWAAALKRLLQSWIFFDLARHRYAYGILNERLLQVLSSIKMSLPDGAILDLPAGEDAEFAILERIGNKVVAGEISYKSLARARQRSTHPMGVCCDAIHLPFANDSFSLVVINMFLHHVVDEGFDDYLRESWRVLKPGGGLSFKSPVFSSR